MMGYKDNTNKLWSIIQFNNWYENFTKKIIYITNNGVLEALGNSQILSYIYKLAQNYDITLISLEKKEDLQIIDYQILKKKLIQN